MVFLEVTWGWFVPSLQCSAWTQWFLSGKKEESSSGMKPAALFMWGYLLNVAGRRKKKKTTAPKSKWKGIYSGILLQISHMPISWSPSVHSLATLFGGLTLSFAFGVSDNQLKSSVKCKGLTEAVLRKEVQPASSAGSLLTHVSQQAVSHLLHCHCINPR